MLFPIFYQEEKATEIYRERNWVTGVSLLINEFRTRTIKRAVLYIRIINNKTVELIFVNTFSYQALY